MKWRHHDTRYLQCWHKPREDGTALCNRSLHLGNYPGHDHDPGDFTDGLYYCRRCIRLLGLTETVEAAWAEWVRKRNEQLAAIDESGEVLYR